jgi:hypothetical protein
MSAFAAVMEIENRKYQVLKFNYSVSRDYDFEGKPVSRPRQSIIEVEVVVPNGDVMFYKWLCFNEVKEGIVIFNKIDEEAKFNQIKFEKSFCMNYKQKFSDSGPNSMTVAVTISTGVLTITSGSEEFSNDYFEII